MWAVLAICLNYESCGMSDEIEPLVAAGEPTTPSSERRRPGRLENVHPSLIPLLRGEAAPGRALEDIQEHGLAPATGIAVSVFLSGLIWIIIGFSVYLLLR